MLAMPSQAAMSSQALAFLSELVAPLLQLRLGKNNVSGRVIMKMTYINTTYKYKDN